MFKGTGLSSLLQDGARAIMHAYRNLQVDF